MGPVPALLQPFTGYIPTSALGHRVAAPSGSVLTDEQRAAARLDPLSFRYAAGRGVHATHEDSSRWIEAALDQGAIQPIGPGVLIYRQTHEHGAGIGIVADVSLAAYDEERIKKHERTIAKTQKKMARYMEETRVYGNPVALAHLPHPRMESVIEGVTATDPISSFVTVDAARHEIWSVADADVDRLSRAFAYDLYITDGHHRLAAAAHVARKESRPDACLPAAIFSENQLRLRSFARCIDDPQMDVDRIVSQLNAHFELRPTSPAGARPRTHCEVGVKLGPGYFRLTIPQGMVPDDDYRSLDANLVQDLLLGPVFGITNPREDKRLTFVADIPVSQPHLDNAATWLLPHPASVGDVMRTADAGLVMPAKSTWFAPKAPSGLAIRSI